jgi:ribosomal protein S18 acetylase RimI-like enzyme
MVKIKIFSTDCYYYINAYINEDRVGKLGIEYKGDNKIHINYVNTDIKHTGEGIATMMLNKAIEIFKGYEISLLVKPMPRIGEKIKYTTTKGLIEFYKKFGFERTEDPCLVTMILKNY